MAETAFLFRAGRTQIDTVVADCTISEGHARELDITEHPVEDGANISDHARLKPEVLSLEVIFSNTVIGGPAAPGRAEDAWERLRLLQEQAKLITVVTSLRVYENMVLATLSTPRSAKEGNAVRCQATLRNIKLVKNKTTTVVVTREPLAKKKQSTGKQASGEATDAEAKRKSLLKRGADSEFVQGLVNKIVGGP